MRILLCNHFLTDFTGSEVASLDLASAFTVLGHQVTVASFESGVPLAGAFASAGLTPARFDTLAGQHFDLIWAHHFTTLDHCLLDLAITADTVIFSSLSPYEALESPPLSLERVNLLLANSPETRATLLNMGLSEQQVRLFANPVGGAFFEHSPGPLPERPRLALVSNHVPPELKAALPLLAAKGVEVTLFGREGRRELITASLLAGFDGIISIGRTVQYGLAMGLPVFCYDHFAGPGWLTSGNIERAAEHNFSGRCTPAARSATGLADDITAGLVMAHQQAGAFRALARERYHLGEQLPGIVAEAITLPAMMPTAGCMRAVALRQRDYYQKQRHRPLRACLYTDAGQGFDERFTLLHELTPPYSQVELSLQPAATGQQGSLLALRLDPLDSPCVVRVHRLELVSNGQRQDVTDRVISNALHQDERLYYFLTCDPQLVLSLEGMEVQRLEASLEFVALGDEAVTRCLGWLELTQQQQQQQQQQQLEQLERQWRDEQQRRQWHESRANQLEQWANEQASALQRMRAHPVWRCLRAMRRLRDRLAALSFNNNQ